MHLKLVIIHCPCRGLCTFLKDYICYDDGCHLRKFATNPVRQVGIMRKQIAEKDIVVDKMHMLMHGAREHCDPKKKPDLDNV